jgi:hypothetical protein
MTEGQQLSTAILKASGDGHMGRNMYSTIDSGAWVRERIIPTERPPLAGTVSAKFADRECHVVSATDPLGRILRFLARSHYCFFQVAPQLYSRGWVDPVSDPVLLRKSDSAENRTRTSESVARNIKIQFVPHKKHNTFPFCSQEFWPLDHRGGQSTIDMRNNLNSRSNVKILTQICMWHGGEEVVISHVSPNSAIQHQ